METKELVIISPQLKPSGELFEATSGSVLQVLPEITTTPTHTQSGEIFEALNEQRVGIPEIITTTTTQTQSGEIFEANQIKTQSLSRSTLIRNSNKPRPYVPIDLDALFATIPPTFVVPFTPTQTDVYGLPAEYINNIEFCYRFLYFVRNNTKNQTDQLKSIAKIIMSYYLLDGTTYFNLEIPLVNIESKDVPATTIITNKGTQKISDMLKEVSTDQQIVQAPIQTNPQPIAGGRCNKTIKKCKLNAKTKTIKMH